MVVKRSTYTRNAGHGPAINTTRELLAGLRRMRDVTMSRQHLMAANLYSRNPATDVSQAPGKKPSTEATVIVINALLTVEKEFP